MSSILNKDELTEDDIMQLINSKVEESNSLEFKRAESLDQSDRKKNEISKDVAAFANSAGGFIVYGIEEENHVATRLSFVDGNVITKEWLEQIIQSKITRKIEGVRIIPIRFGGDITKTVYVVKIPDSPAKPHQSSDKKYYRRYEFNAVPMEEYEVQNMYNLKNKCLLKINNVLTKKRPNVRGNIVYFHLNFYIENIGTSISNQYKLIIQVNYDKLMISYHPHFNKPHYFMVKPNLGQISYTNESPIYPDEILSIGEIEFGVEHNDLNYMLDEAEFKLRLFFEGGVENKSFRFSDIVYFDSNDLVDSDENSEHESE